MNSVELAEILAWLEAHDKLAGWAQFLGAMMALLLTYFTAFAPVWRRKRYLRRTAERLLAHGYEALESYHTTSAHFVPFPHSLRQAALSLNGVADELRKFPVHELEDQGENSRPRRIMAMTSLLAAVGYFLNTMADELDGRTGTTEDQDNIREFVAVQLKVALGLANGTKLERPEPPRLP